MKNKNKFIRAILEESYKELNEWSAGLKFQFSSLLKTLIILENFTGPFKGKRILDLGSGIGINALALSKLGAEVFGVDRHVFEDKKSKIFFIENHDKLRKIWEKNNVKVFNYDIATPPLPFEPQSFDLVMSEAVIEHLKNPKDFLLEKYRLLKPEGYMFFSTPNFSNLLRRVRFLFGLSPNWDIRQFFQEGDSFIGHWREYTMKELRTMCELAGFETIKSWNINTINDKFTLKSKHNLTAYLFNKGAFLFPGARDANFILCRKKS